MYTETIRVNISIKRKIADLIPMKIHPLVVYTVARDYRRNKSIPSLRNLFVQVKQTNKANYRLYPAKTRLDEDILKTSGRR